MLVLVIVGLLALAAVMVSKLSAIEKALADLIASNGRTADRIADLEATVSSLRGDRAPATDLAQPNTPSDAPVLVPEISPGVMTNASATDEAIEVVHASEAPVERAEAAPPLPPTKWAYSPSPPSPIEEAPAVVDSTPEPAASFWRGFDPMRWAIWVGGIALALGGMFLIKQMAEVGLFGPRFRIIMGIVFAVALVWFGDRLRRGIGKLDADPLIGSVVTGAGLVMGYAVVYAAHAIYGFIGPTLALVVLGAVAVGSVLLAARHTIWIGLVGLLGAYAAPVVLAPVGLANLQLLVYLAFLTAAIHVIARLQSSILLSQVAGAAAGLWTFAFLAAGTHWLQATHALIQSLMAAVFLVVLPLRARPAGEPYDRGGAPWSYPLAAIAFFAIGLAHVQGGVVGPTTAVGIVAVIGLFTASAFFEELAVAAILAPAASVLMAWNWPHPDFGVPLGYAAFAALVAIAGFASVYQRVRRWQTDIDIMKAVCVAVVGFPIIAILIPMAWARHGVELPAPFYGLSMLIVALVCAGTALAIRTEEIRKAGTMRIGEWFLLAAPVLAAHSAFIGLGRTWIPAAVAVIASATLYGARHVDCRRLWGAGALVAGVSSVAGLGFFAYTASQGFPGLPVIVPMLGLSGAILLLTARFVARSLDEPWRSILDGSATALLLSFAMALVHLASGSLAPEHGRWILLEAASHFVVIATATFMIARIAAERPSVFINVALVLARIWLALHGAVGLLVLANPWYSGEPVVGWPIVNSLTAGYLIPAAVLFYFRRKLPADNRMALIWGVTASLLCLAWATLSVRFAFAGADLTGWSFTEAETTAYSVVWVLCGIAATVIGTIRGVRELSLLGSALLMFATCKVFLVDMRHVGGMLRALSFMGLGISLIAIAIFVRWMDKIRIRSATLAEEKY